MRKTLFTLIALTTAWLLQAQSVTITEVGGWRETAYIKWLPVEDAMLYKVYYSGEGIFDQLIDTQLIRSYGSYFRADIPGLRAGTYTLKVVPVINNQEGEATTSSAVNVVAHDRTGFAFFNGRVPGAYKADGTPKSNAVILYITQNTKNTVSLEVSGANANPCVGIQTILDGFKKGRDTRPLIVRLIGQITDPDYLLNGDMVVENNNNASSYITIEGIGDDAVADGWGIRIKNATNIEIRNLGTMNCDSGEGDNIGLQQDNSFVWVHHCDFFYGKPGGDADQAKGDGALDSKRSGYVTFSYNHFWDTGKSNLLGNGAEDPEYLTYHHNWYDHSDSRHPRVRSHHVHVFNNYYDGISKYGVGSTLASSVFVEANYFRNCVYPMLISMQGSDVWSSSRNANDYTNMPTFSKEAGGIIKSFNNYITGQRRFVAYGDAAFPNSTVDFDAYVVSSASEQVPASVKAFQGGSTYSNFDTNPQLMYSYTADSPEEARNKVILWAGRMMGGDFKWTFNNSVDDTSYDVNIPLRNALAAYTTSLVAVQGDGNAQGGGDTGGGDDGGDDEGDGEQPTGDVFHNFTTSGKTSSFFNISGNLSDSKGTVEYAGLTLTMCLKIESATTIGFTLQKEAVLTLVFNSGFNGKIKVNGADRSAVNGVLTLVLPAGSHQVTKADVCNLYYLGINYVTTGGSQVMAPKPLVVINRTDNRLYVQDADAAQTSIRVYSVAGKLMLAQQNLSDGADLSHLPKGIYLVAIKTENGDFMQKLQK